MDVVEPAVVVSSEAPSSPSPEAAAPTLRHRLEYAAFRALLVFARLLPLGALTGLGAFVVGFVGPRLRQNRRALANLAIAFPEKTEDERRSIARAMWANMGRTFAETLVLDRLVADPSRMEIVDREHWHAVCREPGPIVGCTLHLGSWELAIWPFLLFGRTPTGVYKPLDNPLLDRWLHATRLQLFPGGLLGKGDRDGSDGAGQRTARQLIERARSGGTVGFVMDHFDRRGEPVPFMGRQARFTPGPAMIARVVGARVLVGCCRRVGTSSRFLYQTRQIEVPQTRDRKGDTLALTTAIFRVFEEWIRANPEQWMWWNTRWMDNAASQVRKES